MKEIMCFIGGMILGGGVSFIFLCCIQLERINEYEAEIKRLRSKLSVTERN